ncbi:hypothetical protein [Boseongicola aestuarii]|uniref:DUF2927 domain-containing protein n=1 Tax=Boseongicola aestuarii TaxID=1470561 RepID=A0A238J676_9RHOB|nr:hypothetical protein [Boseongicola aestuarii]SMX25873.1 hypothetical protein BOA8489_04018 [Boseongicola aestuarii]
MEEYASFLRKLAYIAWLAIFPIVLWMSFTGQAEAVEFVKSKGKLSDRDFYRLVACAAVPGGKCQKPFMKWDARDRSRLTIGFTEIDPNFSERKKEHAWKALQNAVGQVNRVGADIELVWISGGRPDISVKLTAGSIDDAGRNQRTVADYALFKGAGAVAEVRLARGSSVIASASITITARIKDKYLKSVMLEEVVQSLGLMTDIHNPYYHKRSIFSEVGSDIIQLRGQDAKALLSHYPRQ